MASIGNQGALEEAFAARYPLDIENNRLMRDLGLKLCRDYLQKGLGNKDAESRLCSHVDKTFWQQLSEVVVADQMQRVGLLPSHKNAGPDLFIEIQEKRVWIEVICPEPAGIPQAWLDPREFEACDLPHEAILLRWTSAIKEKAEKLIGKPNNEKLGYLTKGYVGKDDVYVIAINGRLLRAGWPQINGISQWPFAVEATFGVGPYAVTFDRASLNVVNRGHQHRPAISKLKGASVPANTFLDPRFTPISAIWAMDFDENLIIGRQQPMVVIHNPAAKNPLERNILPALSEYVAINEVTHYNLTRHDGRLPYS